jgi:undecaprenyl-diphosphatase
VIEWLHQIELQILFFVNTGFTHPWADVFFVNVTDLHKNPVFAILALGALSYFSIRKYGRDSWRVLVALVLAIAIGDMVGYRLIKANVDRPRPFQNEAIASHIMQRSDAHGNSFPSNHAINCFAGATILSLAFPAGSYIFYIFAAIVGYSRLYLGVHYPSDVLFGALLGFVIARIVALFLLNKFKSFAGPRS